MTPDQRPRVDTTVIEQNPQTEGRRVQRIAGRTLNTYAGGIGEILGVALITGIWTVLIGTVVMRSRGRAATIAGGFAVAMGLSLWLVMPSGFGVEVGPVLTISNIGW